MTRGSSTVVALSGLMASLVAIVLHATADRTLIYGRWPAVDVGARPYGPFVNRNHFAAWLVMAVPLSLRVRRCVARGAPRERGRSRKGRGDVRSVGLARGVGSPSRAR